MKSRASDAVSSSASPAPAVLRLADAAAAVEGATRVADTKCAPNQLTAAEVEGYDADTGKLVAEAMGVEPCFVTPPWSEITAGNWGDRWDIAWGSGALTTERMTRLWVTQPYYSTPHNFFVPADSTVQDAAELSGKEVGACAGCTQELYLKHELELPGVTLDYAVTDPKIVTFDAEPPGEARTCDGDHHADDRGFGHGRMPHRRVLEVEHDRLAAE